MIWIWVFGVRGVVKVELLTGIHVGDPKIGAKVLLWSPAVCPLLIAEIMIEKDKEILLAVRKWCLKLYCNYLLF